MFLAYRLQVTASRPLLGLPTSLVMFRGRSPVGPARTATAALVGRLTPDTCS